MREAPRWPTASRSSFRRGRSPSTSTWSSVQDYLVDGDQIAKVVAYAPRLSSGEDTLVVTDSLQTLSLALTVTGLTTILENRGPAASTATVSFNAPLTTASDGQPDQSRSERGDGPAERRYSCRPAHFGGVPDRRGRRPRDGRSAKCHAHGVRSEHGQPECVDHRQRRRAGLRLAPGIGRLGPARTGPGDRRPGGKHGARRRVPAVDERRGRAFTR